MGFNSGFKGLMTAMPLDVLSLAEYWRCYTFDKILHFSKHAAHTQACICIRTVRDMI